MRTARVALLFAFTSVAVAADPPPARLPDGAVVRIPGPVMWLPRGLQLTPDGRYATDGEYWIDLKTETRCPKPKDAPDLSARWLTQVQSIPVEDGGTRYQFSIAERPQPGKKPAWQPVGQTERYICYHAHTADGGVFVYLADGNGPVLPRAFAYHRASGETVRLLPDSFSESGVAARVGVSTDGRRAAVLDSKRLYIADTATGKEVRKFDTADHRYSYDDPRGTPTLLFTPDGKTVVVRNQKEKRLDLFPATPEGEVRSIAVHDFDVIDDYAVTPDSKRVAVKNTSGTVRVYDLATGKRTDRGDRADFWADVHWLGDGRFATWTKAGLVCVWDAATGKRVREIKVGLPPPPEPQGQDVVQSFRTPGLGGVRFSKDGKHFATWDDDGPDGRGRFCHIRVYEVTTGKRGIELPEKLEVKGFDFHPDGKSLVVSTTEDAPDKRHRDELLLTFDLATGEQTRTELGFNGADFVLSDDGRSALTLNGFALCWVERATGRGRWVEPTAALPAQAPFPGGFVVDGHHVLAIDETGGHAVYGSRDSWRTDFVVRDLVTGKKKWATDGRNWQSSLSANARWVLVSDDVGESDPMRPNAEYKSHRVLHLFDLRQKSGDATVRSFTEAPIDTDWVEFHAVSDDGRRAVLMEQDYTLTVWDLDRLRAIAPKVKAKRDLWMGLADEFHYVEAMRALHADPAAAVKLLADKLPPADGGKVRAWIDELNSPDFRTRERAEKELAAVAIAFEPGLRAAAAKPASAEAGQRLERLLKRASVGHGQVSRTVMLPPDVLEHLRVRRAAEIVERIGTPEAAKLLERWAGGAPEAVLTVEATESLKRLKARR